MVSTKKQTLSKKLFRISKKTSHLLYQREEWRGKFRFVERNKFTGRYTRWILISEEQFTKFKDKELIQIVHLKPDFRTKVKRDIKEATKEEFIPEIKKDVDKRDISTFARANILIVQFTKTGKTMKILYTLPNPENIGKFNGVINEKGEMPYNEYVKMIKMDVFDKTGQTLESHLFESKVGFKKKVFGTWSYRVIERVILKTKKKDIIRKERFIDLQAI